MLARFQVDGAVANGSTVRSTVETDPYSRTITPELPTGDIRHAGGCHTVVCLQLCNVLPPAQSCLHLIRCACHHLHHMRHQYQYPQRQTFARTLRCLHASAGSDGSTTPEATGPPDSKQTSRGATGSSAQKYRWISRTLLWPTPSTPGFIPMLLGVRDRISLPPFVPEGAK